MPLRLPSAHMGPLRSATHLVVGSGRFSNLSDRREARRTRRDGPGTAIHGLRVFAVEPTRVQLDWAALGPGVATFRCADTTVELVTDGGSGAVDLDDLPTGRNLAIGVSLDPGGHRIELAVTTPPPPPGAEIARVATFSDSHIGETSFGYLHTISEPDRHAADHPVRAVRAAVDEALAWGAERLVCKGDIVDQSHPGNWRQALGILGDLPVPVHLTPGNHEVKSRRSVEPATALAGTTVHCTTDVDHVDLGGACLVLVRSALDDHERGDIAVRTGQILDALGATRGGALVAMHHHLRSGTSVSAWPVGIPRRESTDLLDRIAQAHPDTMITSGHVHRNRLRRHGPLTVTCVGSVKDYPGVWAGYVFHEGGIRQVIRRVSEPSVIAWTERTGDALGGFYRRWTPSTLERRCVTVEWSAPSGR